jgi:hypothetical protein
VAGRTREDLGMNRARTSGFHAGGQWAFQEAIKKNSEYQKKREAEKRQQMEGLLTVRLEEFQSAGYWKRQAILKEIHLQLSREFSLTHCLF